MTKRNPRPRRDRKPDYWKTPKKKNIFKKSYNHVTRRFKEDADPTIKKVRLTMRKLEEAEKAAELSSGRLAHRIGTDKLDSLGFDPMEALIKQLKEVEDKIEEEYKSEAPRHNYIEKLMTLKFKILDTVLPYKYGKAPIVTTHDSDPRTPINIVLTLEDE